MKKIVLLVDLHDGKAKQKALKTVATLSGIDSIGMEMKEKKLTVVGKVDPITLVSKLRKQWPTTDLISVGPVKEPEKKDEAKKEGGEKEGESKKEDEKKDGTGEIKEDEKKDAPVLVDPIWKMYHPHHLQLPQPYHPHHPPHHLQLPQAYHPHHPPQLPRHYYVQSMEENPHSCIIC